MHLSVLGVSGALVYGAIIALVVFLTSWAARIAFVMRGGPSVDAYLRRIRTDEFSHYRSRLLDGLRLIADLTGDARSANLMSWSSKTYAACLALATVYPIGFTLISWVILGNSGALGWISMPDGVAAWKRAIYIALVLIAGSLGSTTAIFRSFRSRQVLVGSAAIIAGMAAAFISDYPIEGGPRAVISVAFAVTFSTLFYQVSKIGSQKAVIETAAWVLTIVIAIESIFDLSYKFNITLPASYPSTAMLAAEALLCSASAFVIIKQTTKSTLFFSIFATACAEAKVPDALINFLDLIFGNAALNPMFETAVLLLLGLGTLAGFGFVAGRLSEMANNADRQNRSLPFVFRTALITVLPAALVARLGIIGDAEPSLFLTMLPAINAPLDWCSLGITLWTVTILSKAS